MLLSLQFVLVSRLFHKNDTGDTGSKIYIIPDSCFVLWVLVSGILLTLWVRRVQQTTLDRFAISRAPRGLQM
jgi:hypothetical protein